MKLLIAHNDYGRPSGEEHALETLADIAKRNGHGVVWLRRSSAEIDKTLAGKAKAFFAGVANPWMARLMAELLDREKPDLVLVQNLYPLLSPSILVPCYGRHIPVIMRCPNYRLFCPNGLHLCQGEVCERCLGGKEYWCLLRNCERDLLKSAGYAMRGWAARVTRRILDNVDIFIVLSEFQRQRFIAQGIPPGKLEILHNITPNVAESSEPSRPLTLSLSPSDGERVVGRPGEGKPSTLNPQPAVAPEQSRETRHLTPALSPVGAEREGASRLPLRVPPSHDGGYIAFVGRASPEKGIEDFVEAARRLPELPFAVAGATERMPWLVKQSPPNVRWLGFLKGREFDEFYRECRVLVCPYRWFEGFPNVVTHAMALRKPVVASRIGALPEIVEESRTGLLFETGNVADLVQRIRTLVDDSSLCLRLGEAGREKALRDYSEEVVARRFVAICEQAVSGCRENREH